MKLSEMCVLLQMNGTSVTTKYFGRRSACESQKESEDDIILQIGETCSFETFVLLKIEETKVSIKHIGSYSDCVAARKDLNAYDETILKLGDSINVSNLKASSDT